MGEYDVRDAGNGAVHVLTPLGFLTADEVRHALEVASKPPADEGHEHGCLQVRIVMEPQEVQRMLAIAAGATDENYSHTHVRACVDCRKSYPAWTTEASSRCPSCRIASLEALSKIGGLRELAISMGQKLLELQVELDVQAAEMEDGEPTAHASWAFDQSGKISELIGDARRLLLGGL
jgi:hypothetical protein